MNGVSNGAVRLRQCALADLSQQFSLSCAHRAHVKEDFAIEITVPALSEQECQHYEIDPRRDARKVVGHSVRSLQTN
jgi:hypothetical protein